MPADVVCLALVDPGVGSDRPAVVLEADGRWFVGPGNGLFEPLRRRARRVRQWRIAWQPERAGRRFSASFHGRDLFAPVAARLARGERLEGDPDFPEFAAAGAFADWPEIGRASGRERGGQYVYMSVGAVFLNKKQR